MKFTLAGFLPAHSSLASLPFSIRDMLKPMLTPRPVYSYVATFEGGLLNHTSRRHLACPHLFDTCRVFCPRLRNISGYGRPSRIRKPPRQDIIDSAYLSRGSFCWSGVLLSRVWRKSKGRNGYEHRKNITPLPSQGQIPNISSCQYLHTQGVGHHLSNARNLSRLICTRQSGDG